MIRSWVSTKAVDGILMKEMDGMMGTLGQGKRASHTTTETRQESHLQAPHDLCDFLLSWVGEHPPKRQKMGLDRCDANVPPAQGEAISEERRHHTANPNNVQQTKMPRRI